MVKENISIAIKYFTFSVLVFIDVLNMTSGDDIKARHPAVFSYN